MERNENRKKVICFGEVLWDNLPSGRKAGGAPMNVAYHLQKMTVDASLISAVGADQAGSALLDFIDQIGLPQGLIQINQSHKTSEVIAALKNEDEVDYDIVYPVAWDFIEWKSPYERLLNETDLFVFGSLASRNDVTRQTLFKMLEYSSFNVFDVNLRTPHYDFKVIEQLLSKTHLLKLNEAELMLLAECFSLSPQEGNTVLFIQEKFGIKEIIVTKGGNGASFYQDIYRYDHPVYPVNVADTVGCGDSFLAAFLAKKLEGTPVATSLDYATALSSFIAGHNGACPPYNLTDLEEFILQKQPDYKS